MRISADEEHKKILSFRTNFIYFTIVRIFASSFLLFSLQPNRIRILDIFSQFLLHAFFFRTKQNNSTNPKLKLYEVISHVGLGLNYNNPKSNEKCKHIGQIICLLLIPIEEVATTMRMSTNRPASMLQEMFCRGLINKLKETIQDLIYPPTAIIVITITKKTKHTVQKYPLSMPNIDSHSDSILYAFLNFTQIHKINLAEGHLWEMAWKISIVQCTKAAFTIYYAFLVSVHVCIVQMLSLV